MAVECKVEHNGGVKRCLRRGAGPKLLIVAPAGQLEAVVAEGFAARLLGIAFLPAAAAPALLIPRCRSVHTFGMRFELDLCFLAMPAGDAGDAAVIEARPRLRPRRLASLPRRAAQGQPIAALELRAGAAAKLGIEPGASVRVARSQALKARGDRDQTEVDD